ncbi:MAG: hypothetical protein ACLFTK_14130 [Anaerolineales bacterium]
MHQLSTIQAFIAKYRRTLDAGVRLALLALCLLELWTIFYQDARESDYFLENLFQGIIYAANEGYPFHIYYGDTEAPLDYAQLELWQERSFDYGIGIILTTATLVGQLIDPDFQLSNQGAYLALMLYFGLVAGVLVFPTVRLPIAVGAMVTFMLWLSLYEATFYPNNFRAWAAGLSVLLIGFALVNVPYPKKTLWSKFHWLWLTFIIAFSLQIREEGAAAIYASLLAWCGLIILAMLIRWAVLHRADAALSAAWPRTAISFAQRHLLPPAVIFLGILLMPMLMQAVYARAWDMSYTDVNFVQHGRGMPLYMGLGYISNPYNSTWLDPQAINQARLYNPDLPPDADDSTAELQHTLQAQWTRIVQDDPAILWRNIYQKMQFADFFMVNTTTPFRSAFLYSVTSHELGYLYRLVPLIYAAMLGFVLLRGHLTTSMLVLTALPLSIGASTGPLTAFPSYISGVQGAVLFVGLVLPIAVWTFQRDKALTFEAEPLPGPLAKREKRYLMLAVLLIAIIGGFALAGFTLLQEERRENNLAEIANGDPLAMLRDREQDYTPYFNSLGQAAQRDLIAQMLQQADESVFVGATDLDAVENSLFSPILTVVTANQIHAVVWLGDYDPMPVDSSLNQSRVHSLVQVCFGCPDARINFTYSEQEIVYSFLNDMDWNNSYRMISLAVDPHALQDVESVHVAAQRLVSYRGNATFFNYAVEVIGGQTLAR